MCSGTAEVGETLILFRILNTCSSSCERANHIRGRHVLHHIPLTSCSASWSPSSALKSEFTTAGVTGKDSSLARACSNSTSPGVTKWRGKMAVSGLGEGERPGEGEESEVS